MPSDGFRFCNHLTQQHHIKAISAVILCVALDVNCGDTVKPDTLSSRGNDGDIIKLLAALQVKHQAHNLITSIHIP